MLGILFPAGGHLHGETKENHEPKSQGHAHSCCFCIYGNWNWHISSSCITGLRLELQQITNGAFCIRSARDGYDVKYLKTAGGPVTLDFNLRCTSGKWFGDKGAFVARKGESHSYVFQVGSQGKCRGGLRAGKDGKVIAYSPYLYR